MESGPCCSVTSLTCKQESHCQYLPKLLYETININRGAERLHLGVRFQRPKQTAEGPVEYENCTSDSAIPQAWMVDAFGAIFNMLVKAVRVVRYAGSSRENE